MFSSLEKGRAQVSYKAVAHDIPLIVMPVGVGHVVDKNTAIVVEPGDSEALAAALTRLDNDAELRREISQARFDWGAVSRQRLEALTKAVSELP